MRNKDRNGFCVWIAGGSGRVRHEWDCGGSAFRRPRVVYSVSSAGAWTGRMERKEMRLSACEVQGREVKGRESGLMMEWAVGDKRASRLGVPLGDTFRNGDGLDKAGTPPRVSSKERKRPQKTGNSNGGIVREFTGVAKKVKLNGGPPRDGSSARQPPTYDKARGKNEKLKQEEGPIGGQRTSVVSKPQVANVEGESEDPALQFPDELVPSLDLIGQSLDLHEEESEPEVDISGSEDEIGDEEDEDERDEDVEPRLRRTGRRPRSTASKRVRSKPSEDSFATYMTEIRRHDMLEHIEEVQLAKHVQVLMRLNAARERLSKKLKRPPTITEWANSVKLVRF